MEKKVGGGGRERGEYGVAEMTEEGLLPDPPFSRLHLKNTGMDYT